MGLKITYTDLETNEVLRETELDNDEVNAFEYVAYNVIDWIDNCFQNRARMAINQVCEEALGESQNVVLKDSDKKSIAATTGIIVKVRDIDISAKKEIVKKAVFESAKERTVKPRSILE